MSTNPIHILQQAFRAAVSAAQAHHALPPFLPALPKGRTVVIGMGKAGAAMAQSLEQHWFGDPAKISGVVVVPYGSTLDTQYLEIIEASHPTPDENSVLAAERIIKSVQNLSADDLVICLISGGGSALLSLPALGLTLAEKQKINQQLLQSGASIDEINCVRKHLSMIKGGRLAVACFPAAVVNLIISDVPGDEPTHIASGPTVADPSSCADALAILHHYDIALPALVKTSLEQDLWESIKPTDPRLPSIQTHLIAAPIQSLNTAAAIFSTKNYPTLLLGDAIEGEAKEVAKVMAGISHSIQRHNQPMAAPCVLLSGGETSVKVKGTGCGGRNVEFLLALAIALNEAPNIYALAADTDGIDGGAAIAGAYISPSTLKKARDLQLDPLDFLQRQDAHSFFKRLDQQIITGPTHTNVNDFRAIVIATN